MTGHDDFDRTLAGWFEADALPPAPAADLNHILDATRERRPRPAWLAGLGSHWVGQAPEAEASAIARTIPWSGVRLSAALILLLLVVALLGGAILVGAGLLQAPPPRPFPLGELAYGLNGDVYLADWDGRNAVKITDGGSTSACGGYNGEGGIWSPNDRFLAYRSAIGGPCSAIVVIYDTEAKRSVSFPGEGWEVSWSPDSSRIATWIDLGNTVGIYGVDGVRQALLAVPPGCAAPGDFDFSWLPDGKSLVGRSCELPTNGQTPARLPTTDPRAHTPWADSPDGTRVAYETNVATWSELVDTTADGTQAQVLIPTGIVGEGRPVWSPSGDRIAFTSGTGPPDDKPEEISVVDVGSQVVTPLASAPATGYLQIIGFSPQGDRVLYGIFDANGDGSSLWSVHADGSNAQLLVMGTGWGDWQH
jgi:hypothetical protein